MHREQIARRRVPKVHWVLVRGYGEYLREVMGCWGLLGVVVCIFVRLKCWVFGCSTIAYQLFVVGSWRSDQTLWKADGRGNIFAPCEILGRKEKTSNRIDLCHSGGVSKRLGIWYQHGWLFLCLLLHRLAWPTLCQVHERDPARFVRG
jgi:hypothetical protein